MNTPDDLGPLPIPHYRVQIVEHARGKLATLLLDWSAPYQLTTAERTALVAEWLAGQLSRAVAVERRQS